MTFEQANSRAIQVTTYIKTLSENNSNKFLLAKPIPVDTAPMAFLIDCLNYAFNHEIIYREKEGEFDIVLIYYSMSGSGAVNCSLLSDKFPQGIPNT